MVKLHVVSSRIKHIICLYKMGLINLWAVVFCSKIMSSESSVVLHNHNLVYIDQFPLVTFTFIVQKTAASSFH